MLRSAGKLFGTAAAGVAASGPAAQPHCRAQQSRSPLQGKDDTFKCSGLPSTELGEDWLVTDLKRDIHEDQVIFGVDEVNETLQNVLDFTAGKKCLDSVAEHPCIKEIDETSNADTNSEVLDSTDANLHIQAAEMQLSPAIVEDDFKRMLLSLLHSQDVQSACVNTLKNDPAFQRLIDSSGVMDVPLHNFTLLPLTARHAAVAEEDENGFSRMVQNLASGIMRLGEAVLQKATEARDLLGKLLIRLGYHVHAALGKPLGNVPDLEENPERLNRQAEMVGNALITVACAILTLVLVKRVHRIRFV